MPAIEALHNRIDLINVPFTDRGSRLMLFRENNSLFIRLVERWIKWESEVGPYRQRPPILSHFKLLNADGIPLDFETDTYPHMVRIKTAVGNFYWTFIDPEALIVRLPAGSYGFEFECEEEHGLTDRRGGTFRGRRNIAYTTNARLVSNEIKPLAEGHFRTRVMLEAHDGDGLVLNVTPRLGYNRSIMLPDIAVKEARERWQQWFDAVPPVLDVYREQYFYAWWIMRAGLLNTRYYFTREALVPSKIHYVGVWHWDQFFHALAYRHVDVKMAEDQIRILFDHQRPDGMFPDAIHDEGLITHLTAPVDEDVTKPPLMAWTILKLFEKSGHRDFLEEAYEPLVRWHNWWLRDNLDEKTGLCHYRHPFSSGLDDSPMWDEGMPVVAPDLNTYLYAQMESLAKIAEVIGQPDDAARYRRDSERHAQRMLIYLWDEEAGLFTATHNSTPVSALTPFSLLPLWMGCLPDSVTARLLRHLTDPTTFWPEWPIPTVAISDPTFNPMQMWRGPTWININYLFIDGLMRIGQHELARRLRRKSLELVMQHKDIYEYYNPLTGERPPKSAPIFGWTSAAFIDLAIQETTLSTTGDKR